MWGDRVSEDGAGDVRKGWRSDFLDKDDCEIGEGDQDQEEDSRIPTQPVKKMIAAATEKSVNSMSRMVLSYSWCILLL